MNQEDKHEEPIAVIRELWQEYFNAPFPNWLRGKDINGIDFVMLDADIAGCVKTFIERDTLNLSQVAMLGLCYRRVSYVLPALYEEGAIYFWRLELMAELVLKEIVKQPPQ